jgi:transcriptional regulator of acetoin/glycerol metabolism
MDTTAKKTLEQTLSQHLWNVTKTAKALGVSRMTLYRLMDKHEIVRDRGSKQAE